MRVENSAVRVTNQYTAMFRGSDASRLQYGDGRQNGRREDRSVSGAPQHDQLYLSEPAKRAQPVRHHHKIDRDEKLDSLDDLRSKLAKLVFKAVTGEDFKLFEPKDLFNAPTDMPRNVEWPVAPASQLAAGASSENALQYDYYASSYQYRSISFSAQGVLKTKDGQEINFSMELSVSQEFYSERQVRFRSSDGMSLEPLVVDFQSNAVDLTQTHFSFALDIGGRSDQVALVNDDSAAPQIPGEKNMPDSVGNSAFVRGGGRRHEDRHRVRDHGDAVYDKLRLWLRHSGGGEQLLALGHKGLGAVYVGHLQPPTAKAENQIAPSSSVGTDSVGDSQKLDLLV